MTTATAANPIEYAKFRCAAQVEGQKFTDADLRSDVDLQKAAIQYALEYDGKFPFVLDIQYQIRSGRGATIAQLRGIMNVILAGVNRQVAAAKEPAPETYEGVLPKPMTYTVEFPDGQHRTIKIEDTEGWDLMKGTGTLVAKFLSGPDNETSFTGFAFIKPDGSVQVWKRFKGGDSLALKALETIVYNPDARAGMGEAYAMKSGRCCKCGRKLTVPASLHRGMGPVCAQGGIDA